MKRSQHRLPMTLNRHAYPSDLTDEQWELLEPLVPAISAEIAYHVHTRREIVNAILYVLRSGCLWCMLPHEFPAWGTVYHSFRRWQREGIWDQILHTLRMQMRQKQGRNAEPSAGNTLSQSIKTSAVRGPEKGYDAGKKSLGANATSSLIRKAMSWQSRSLGRIAPTSKEAGSCLSRSKSDFPG